MHEQWTLYHSDFYCSRFSRKLHVNVKLDNTITHEKGGGEGFHYCETSCCPLLLVRILFRSTDTFEGQWVLSVKCFFVTTLIQPPTLYLGIYWDYFMSVCLHTLLIVNMNTEFLRTDFFINLVLYDCLVTKRSADENLSYTRKLNCRKDLK
jgi:hypothetical protein